jgi:hypothetical protein
MPKFLDHHSMPPMSAEQKKVLTEQLKSSIKSKKADSFGVIILNVFMGDGQSFGYTDAPNAEAVVKNHAAMGIKISAKDVTEVTSIS